MQIHWLINERHRVADLSTSAALKYVIFRQCLDDCFLGPLDVRECVDIATYLHWAQLMQIQYGAKDVFVATDSPSFLAKVKAWTGFRVMSISMPRVETHERAVWGFASGVKGVREVRRFWREVFFSSDNFVQRSDLQSHHPQQQQRQQQQQQQQGVGGYHATDAAQSAVLDLLLLSETSMFIGTMTSSLARNAYELMCARAAQPLPFISLDAAW